MFPLPPAKDILVLMPGICKYVHLLSKKIFLDVIELRILRGEENPVQVGPMGTREGQSQKGH